MDRLWSLLGVVFISLGGLVFMMAPQRIAQSDLTLYTPDLANGETMFNAGGCSSCHTAPLNEDKCDDPKGGKRLELAGGRCFRTPFGAFYAPNISPHKESGIGAWSEAHFASAVLRGTSPKGEHYYPAFPYPSYQRMALKDVRDLWAYLKTLPSVASTSRKHALSFPYSLRSGLGLWKLLYFDGKGFVSDPTRSAELNRGAYLVEGPGHCGECHTPRNPFGGPIAERKLAGGPAPEGKGRIPNITPHRTGLGSWSKSDIAYGLKSGFTPEFDTMGGVMTKVQENIARLSDDDRKAIAAYLKSIPAIAGKKKSKPAAP